MNAMVQSTNGRSRLPRAQRELQILDIAHARFAERGYAAVTMDEVASAAGVTKPLLYAYFGNKERLYRACMERAGEAMLATVVEAIRAAEGPTEALRDGLRAFFAFVDGDRDAWRVLFDETHPVGGELARSVADYRQRLVGLVAETQLALVPEHNRERAATEVEALSHALLGASEALARWWLRTGAMPPADAAELLVATVEPGLQARAALRFIPPTPEQTKEPNDR
ncbi:transcriptional regulator, TetR family [Conexibacter woesei DSM 14684]|uniref:Transcriptional regulator, TetR family n=2 Tax=Conexibacter TaxID=191494 RepID=D3F552_CONWI|nr:transcriptional regulator, TetR family [Conexibacter woesei DSM 14684]